ncbi:MAG: hypothetical protein JGK24_22110 [Microcoleus sp. PH2017_29_MFU_D_A]|uniref:hypothetical protein n=2 Tax=Microcoleus TaxID=44471 RepID=UPI001DF719F1|nr:MULTISPECIES: hypothetical protein [unclassified Microcoleus]MCC3420469.1 hypothetical protein [Microcoleus sp. PH2017_07_MST_O_A]MCC3591084.1 hypothetical protein [Microcoleus sp. PH2017_28_MFU_U_A]TAE54823.1 MAG: hypothetical protein EAZ88_07975 [Oscillatoriales cyanobacterium]MCC3425372.1 hypothetical protein [Microcoleus sp. PH2017_01_SCD_O_A]MCC3456597.1 hypothetical protein [Microcoleus sp. PH2017_08_TRC_O_A]
MEDKAMSSSAIGTLIKIMETLPETLQDRVVEHLQEYILKSNITVTVSPDGKLEIPAEVESQLKPGDRYTVTVTKDSIVFQKMKAGFDWEEWRRRIDSLPPDPNPMTIEEICEVVREVRREKISERESQLLEPLYQFQTQIQSDTQVLEIPSICSIPQPSRVYEIAH